MAIAIPAIVDAQLALIQAALRPVKDAATNTDSLSSPPYALGNRVADILRLLTELCGSGTLTGVGVHTAADATNNIAVAAVATDLATSQTLLNAMRDGTGEAGGGVAAHFVIVGANEHIGADITNAITAIAAVGLPTALLLANDIKAQLNGHLLLNAATGHYGPELTNTILSPDATDLPTVIVLANELRAKYNLHVANIAAGSLSSFIDNAAITGVSSLVGATVTFAAATTTVALRDIVRTISASNVNGFQFSEALPAVPVIGDTLTLAWSGVDAQLAVLDGGKGTGNSQSQPYSDGRNMLNACVLIIQQLGGALPAYVDLLHSAEPYNGVQGGWANPHSGGGTRGHGGGALVADLLEVVRDTVNAWTVPA